MTSNVGYQSIGEQQETTSERRRNEQGEALPGDPSLHSGLSALLNAVTLQLGGDAEAGIQVHPTTDNSTRTNTPNEQDDESLDSNAGKSPATTTPTIVPEISVSKKRSFVELLMTLLMNPSNSDIITFLPDGKFFAIHSREFTLHLMKQHFGVDKFQDFLDQLANSGFTRIETCRSGIEVFRHPQFREGDWEKCETMIARTLLPPDQDEKKLPLQPLESMDDSSSKSTTSESIKRRLSPAHVDKQKSSSAFSSRKVRLQQNGLNDALVRSDSLSDEFRSQALSITTDELNLKSESDNDDDEGQHSLPWVQQAVAGATRTIVTDAIETLLRDEDHSRQTFLRHEHTLSMSSLPGVVPLTKQLFSPKKGESTTGITTKKLKERKATMQSESNKPPAGH